MREKFLFENKNKNSSNEKIELPLLKKKINNSSNTNNIFNKNQLLFYNNISNESPSTTAFTNSNKNILKSRNLTHQISKYRLGLLSANSSLTNTNNNNNNKPMIPIIPINRPVSNFNFGGNQLWELDNINSTKNNSKNNIKNSNNIESNPILNDILIISKTTKNKNTVKSVDMKGKSHIIDKFNINNNLNTNKLHKIKVENILAANNNIFGNILNKQLSDFKNNNNNDFFHMSGIKSHSVKK